eukprot:2419706-Pyramimonas_sp.AAC.1
MKSFRSAARARAAVCISSRQQTSYLSHNVEYSAGTFTKLSGIGPARAASSFASTGLPSRDRDHLTYNSHLSAILKNNSQGPTFASQGVLGRSFPSGITGQVLKRGFRSEAPRAKDVEPKSAATSLSPNSFDELEAMAASQLETREDDDLLEDFRALNLNYEEDRAKLQAQLAISSKRQQKYVNTTYC